MSIIKSYFGKKIKKIRKNREISQEVLAEKIGINRRQLTRIETGKSFPSFETLDSLCVALNIAPKDLFNFDEFQEENKFNEEQAGLKYESIVAKIFEKIKNYEDNLLKLKFILLAINCLEDKSYIEKLQSTLSGMLL